MIKFGHGVRSVLESVRFRIVRHREFLKFALVGGFTFLIDNGIWYALKWTVLSSKPTVAKVIGILIATVVSYVLSREWSFRREGERRHEALYFFAISGVSMIFNSVPLFVSRNLLGYNSAHGSLVAVEFADFLSGAVIGTVIAMIFRYWALRKWVFGEVEPSTADSNEPAPVMRMTA